MKTYDILDRPNFFKITDLENFFKVSVDKNNAYVFNLNETLVFDVDKSRLTAFVCDQYMHWPLLSYKIYGTTRLAWLLMKINKVSANDMFKIKNPGDIIYAISNELITDIVNTINKN